MSLDRSERFHLEMVISIARSLTSDSRSLINLNSSIDQVDIDGFLAGVEVEFRFIERWGSHLFRRVVRRAIALLGNSQHVLIHLPVAVLVMQHRNGISATRNILEYYAGTQTCGDRYRRIAAVLLSQCH